MLVTTNIKPFSSQIKSISLYVISTILTAVIIAVGLVTSTQVSGYHLQNVYFPVNKTSCTCDCWDGFFRGVYSRGRYKLFYFNYEKAVITILSILLFYSEILRQTLVNIFLKRQLILILIIPSIYSNFYGIWSIINYINDSDYNRMLKSQIYFSITELIASYLFYQCLIIKNKLDIPPWFVYFLSTISFLHILLAFGELNIDQIGRNIGLILSDLISIGWIILILIKNQRLRPNRRIIFTWLAIAIGLWLFYHIFCPFIE